ncbi:type I restriction endonuclease subunit S [Salinivibrio siamensis]|uniref:Type I restriction endonuclease subunit S n=1 Tax=Salinivibrio siamensis TaxID=414286 RepID=A0ABX3K769_9GAMM|nr:restriction endonuclease subunit S [Salinivibrio siamensis]OOE83486.1 type I restriction endonuclease subunit S [Salinivibrio siamensis]
MSKYQAYPKYEPINAEWLSEIPIGWSTTPLKHVASINMGQSPSSDDCNIDGIGVPFLQGNAEFGVKSPTEKQFCPIPKKVAKAGDLLFSVRAPVGSLNFANKDFGIGRGLCSIRGTNAISQSFLWWVLPSYKYQFDAIATGSTFEAVSAEEVGNLNLALPPILEQTQIANFLDHETAKIDTLIEKQQQLIKLLKEKRQAVISHAVTKGLNPQAPMKDSGVEWLGEVPEHWVTKSYRYACRIYRGKFGHRPRNDPAFYDGDYPFIQTGDVARAGKMITTYSQTLNEKGKEVSQLFPSGTLVMAIAANIGDTAILGFEAYAPDSVVGFKPYADLDIEFLRYSFMAALPALEQTSTQSTQANLNVDRIGAVKAVFPTCDEQREIVQYLDGLLNQYDSIEKRCKEAIALMQERRTALISAAVTGKIDVRNWQAPTSQQQALEQTA